MRFDYIPTRADKRPIASGWLTATYTETEIKASEYVGVRCGTPHEGGHLVVVDIDVKGGDGEAAWAAFVGSRGLPETYEVRTRSGGRHLYYRSAAIVGCPSSGVPHVDIRGRGGFVCAPPSPGYVVVVDRGVAWLPVWLEQHLVAQGSTSSDRGRRSDADLAADEPVELDRDAMMSWCARHPGLLSSRIESLLRGQPVAGPGMRHEILRQWMIPQILGVFGPGVTLDSLARLFGGDYSGGEFPAADRAQLADALVTARRKCDPSEHVEREEEDETLDRMAETSASMRCAAVTAAAAEVGQTSESMAVREALRRAGSVTPVDLAWAFLATSPYVYSAGDWYTWCGSHWQRVDEPPTHAVQDTLTRAGFAKPRDFAKSRLDEVLYLCRSLSHDVMGVRMDSDRALLSFRNGTWDARSETLRASRQSDYLTRHIPVDLDLSATHAEWDAFLGQISCGDQTWVDHLQFLIGAAFGARKRELFTVLSGAGANGKSALIQILTAVFGGHACALNADVLIASARGTGHTSQIGRAVGSRLVLATEMSAGQLSWHTVKQMCGDSPICVQTRMGGDFVDIKPSWATIVDMNGVPKSREDSHAERRRLRVMPFDWRVPAEVARPGWAAEMCADTAFAAAVAAWVIRGSRGAVEPRCTRERELSDSVFTASDPLEDWLDECTQADPGGWVPRSAAYQSYCLWAGRDAISRAELYRRLDARFANARVRRGVRGFAGITLKG
jgi:putative DNA primase/helicase